MMKEESSTNMMPRRWTAIREVCKVLPVIAGLMILIVLLVVALGEFSFDTSGRNSLIPKGRMGPEFGLYYSAMRGLQSYYNPAIELIIFTQFCALLMLPIVLAVFRKRLHITVMPWVLVALFLVLCQLLGLFNSAGDGRYILDSKLPWLLWFEVITLFGIVLSHAVYRRLQKYRKKYPAKEI